MGGKLSTLIVIIGRRCIPTRKVTSRLPGMVTLHRLQSTRKGRRPRPSVQGSLRATGAAQTDSQVFSFISITNLNILSTASIMTSRCTPSTSPTRAQKQASSHLQLVSSFQPPMQPSSGMNLALTSKMSSTTSSNL